MADRIPLTDDQLVGWLPHIENAVCRVTRGVERDEVYADTLLRMIEKRHLINDRKQIFAVVRSRSVNRFRKWKRLIPTDPDEIEIEARDDPFESLHFKEVIEAIARLPKHFQVALKLAAEGLSYDEMSAAMGIPSGTVRSRLARARIALKKQLE